MVSSRLDKLLVSKELILQGISLETNTLYSSGSNHCLVTVVAEIMGTPKNRPFSFDGFWLDHPNFVDKVKKWWQEVRVVKGSKMFMLQQKLKPIKEQLKMWNKYDFGNSFQQKKDTEVKI